MCCALKGTGSGWREVQREKWAGLRLIGGLELFARPPLTSATLLRSVWLGQKQQSHMQTQTHTGGLERWGKGG